MGPEPDMDMDPDPYGHYWDPWFGGMKTYADPKHCLRALQPLHLLL